MLVSCLLGDMECDPGKNLEKASPSVSHAVESRVQVPVLPVLKEIIVPSSCGGCWDCIR